jgi:hypothetical protein
MARQSNEPDCEKFRYMTVAERRDGFQALKRKKVASDTTAPEDGAMWHVLDNPMTLEQYDRLPPVRSNSDTRAIAIWVRFRHRRLKMEVASTGYFDYDGGIWTARIDPPKEGDYRGPVTPSAWKHIVPGQSPWDGPVISD